MGRQLSRHHTGKVREDARVLFASIQTLGQANHLRRFARDRFDYIVVDEFHHADAPTYRRLIEHFQPQFLLGLTATPERTDGGDLLGLCLENLVFRRDLAEGITDGLLCPFHYFGVPDVVDYANLKWRSGRFDPTELEAALVVETRAANALEQYRLRAGRRTLVFCASQRHADYTDAYFRQHGVRSAAVHTHSPAPRAESLTALADGQLDVLCCVDMFNEGLDLPQIDTVMMLRPTESRILWLQQLGRGLRLFPGKSHLNVIDYIGNHRSFLNKPRALFNLSDDTAALQKLIEQLRMGGTPDLPPGCEVTYDLEAIALLENLTRTKTRDFFAEWYREFRYIHERRPRALEAFHAGYKPRSARQLNGSWLGFVAAERDLSAPELAALDSARAFLQELEVASMTRCYKMVLIQALLNLDALPGVTSLEALSLEFASVASRSAHLQKDLSVDLADAAAVQQLLIDQPVKDWTREPFFRYEDKRFHSIFDVDPAEREALRGLVGELVEWRLADCCNVSDKLLCEVVRSGAQLILRLPERSHHPELPSGTAPVLADGQSLEGTFVQTAISGLRKAGDDYNVLPRLLRTWFGPDAGQPGTHHQVELHDSEGVWTLAPLNSTANAEAVVGKSYAREQIPGLFGLSFNPAIWNAGYVRAAQHIFLLVTLDKAGMADQHRYHDRFVSFRQLLLDSGPPR